MLTVVNVKLTVRNNIYQLVKHGDTIMEWVNATIIVNPDSDYIFSRKLYAMKVIYFIQFFKETFEWTWCM